MSGMGAKVNLADPNITSAFHGSMTHQFFLLLLLTLALVVLTTGFYLYRAQSPSQGSPASKGSGTGSRTFEDPEALPRKILRYSFGVLWIFDGLLQLQPGMPLGMPTVVMAPQLTGQPSWLRSIISFGIDLWERHPIQAADSLVWIQVGLGIWLIVAKGTGRWSRAAGGASALWALGVWVGGEALGGIFAPGASWFFGAPGAVVFYGIAGVLLAMPAPIFRSRRAGTRVLRGLGVLMAIFGILQAIPGRGFWSGKSLYAMTNSMSQSSQPNFAHSLVSSFASLSHSSGPVVNAILVVILLVAAGTLILGKPNMVMLGSNVVLAVVAWVFTQDFGVFGGEGTDPNAAIPVLLLVVVGYLWLNRAEAKAHQKVPASWRVHAGGVARELFPVPVGAMRWVPVAVALVITVIGSAPLAYASISSKATTVAAQAIDGLPSPTNFPAPNFQLTDQNGHIYSLSSFRGKVVFLTFLDPVCTTDCPVIAQEMRQADLALGANASKAVFLAVAANRQFYSQAATALFTSREHLNTLSNFHFLTGSLPALEGVWKAYGEEVEIVPAGQMALHSDIAEILDPNGIVKWVEFTDPGPSTSATQASFSQLFFQYVDQTISASA